MITILFDIDGTLVRTGGAGKAAMESALREAFDVPEIKDVVPYSGRTDLAISRDLLAVHDRPSTQEHVLQLTQQYLERLPASLNLLGGEVCPGIRELLVALHPREDILLGLLTGNVVEGAKKKLGHFGLWDYFRLGGFGDDQTDRDDVARQAIVAVEKELRRKVNPADVWIIGDTPLDVKCARAVGAKAVAVATGWIPLEELQACEPDYAFTDLSDVAKVLRLWT